MRGNAPAAQLLRALGRLAGAARLEHEAETPWSSATFVGAQHRVIATGDVAWAAGLDDADLPMRGHFVASVDVAATATGALLTILVLQA